MKVRFQDKEFNDRLAVHTTRDLSDNMSETREGFLLCRNVPVARIGIQDYLNEELVTGADDDMEPGTNGIIRVERNEDEVFRPETLASFEGKDVVIDHPDDEVGPVNYKEHTVGVALHPRRGEGEYADCMVCDLLIKDKEAIQLIRDKKMREVSCGYDAEYESLGPGKARQYDITGNHIALVPRGRCGRRCSIGDEEMTKKTSVLDRLMTAFSTKDKKGFDEAMGELGAQSVAEPVIEKTGPEAVTETHVHIHMPGEKEAAGKPEGTVDELPVEGAEGDAPVPTMDDRMAALEASVAAILKLLQPAAEEGEEVIDEQQGEEEASGASPDVVVDEVPEELKDDKTAKKTGDKAVKDSSALDGAFKDAVSGAEILAPGLKMPTFDRAAAPRTTADSICLLKRRALAASIRTDDGAEIMEQLTGKRTLDGKMACDALGVVFNGAVALMKDRNGVIDKSARKSATTKDGAGTIKDARTFNDKMREHYKQPAARH